MIRWSILFSFFFSSLCSEIVEVDSLDSILGQFDFIKRDVLVVFDLDHTLIRPKDALFHTSNLKKRDQLLVEYAGNDWKECDDCVRSEWYKQREIEYVNPKAYTLIQKLQSKGVKVIALTHSRVGPMGYIESFERFRCDELQKLGVDFSSAFPKIHLISFLEWEEGGLSPLYLEGVLFTAHRKKGELLSAFLDRVDFMPRRVIMLDDTLVQLQRVEEAMKARHIPFLGFLYNEAKQQSKKLSTLATQLQVERLLDHHQWISDVEVEKLIDSVQEYRREDREALLW